MNVTGTNPARPDPADVRRQLDEVVGRVSRGEILGCHARIVCGAISMTIKEARRFLGESASPVIYAAQGEI